MLRRMAIPTYRPGDNKNAQDEAFHEILNELYEKKLKLMDDELYQKKWGVQRKSPSKKERDENDEVPEARKKKKICSKATCTKEQMKPTKKRRLEPHEPQECLTLHSLVNFVLHFTYS
jgi:hypothetical protein